MESRKANITRLLLFTLGMTAMSTQVIMIRESLALFQGNELIIGLFLGVWMMLTAAGSYIATRLRVTGYGLRVTGFLSLLLALLPLTTLFLLVILRFVVVPAGVMPGLGQSTLVIFFALLPFCIVSGMLFPIQIQRLSALRGINALYEGYALESAGSIMGGLLFSLFFIFVLPPYESLVLLTLICVVVIIVWLYVIKRKLIAFSLLVFTIIMILLNYLYEPARFLDNLQFNKQEVVEIKSSPYGMLTVTRIGEQFFIYENGAPINMGDDPVSREESAHYAMLLHPSPGKILVISGGNSGIIEEILKYPVSKIDYVETNPWLLRLAGKYRSLPDDKRVNYIFEDPRIFLTENNGKYDVILINTPEPNSAALNRFYTVELYKLLKEHLNQGGIISVSIPAAGNYMSETSRQVHSVNYNTLGSVFRNIRIIPGGKDYYLASDVQLDGSFLKQYDSVGIDNAYVNPSYISEPLQKMRAEQVMKDLLPEAQANSDLKPYIFSYYLKQWLSRFKVDDRLIPAILVVILVIAFTSLGPLNLGLFAGGFTSSALEFLLLIWFQVIFGFVYLAIGLIFAVFMAGMAIGSFYRHKLIKNSTFRNFHSLQAAMAIFSALVALIFFLLPTSKPQNLQNLLIPCLVFLSGLLMGMQFSLSAQLRKSNIIKSSGESFSADLLGSAIGIMITSVYLVPQLGLPMTAFALAGLNAVAMGVAYIKR